MEIEEDKIRVVREYLRAKFPGCEIPDKYEFDYVGQSFGIDCGEVFHYVTITQAFFSDNSTKELSSWLKNSEIAQQLSNKETSLRFIVMAKGVTDVVEEK